MCCLGEMLKIITQACSKQVYTQWCIIFRVVRGRCRHTQYILMVLSSEWFLSKEWGLKHYTIHLTTGYLLLHFLLPLSPHLFSGGSFHISTILVPVFLVQCFSAFICFTLPLFFYLAECYLFKHYLLTKCLICAHSFTLLITTHCCLDRYIVFYTD